MQHTYDNPLFSSTLKPNFHILVILSWKNIKQGHALNLKYSYAC